MRPQKKNNKIMTIAPLKNGNTENLLFFFLIIIGS